MSTSVSSTSSLTQLQQLFPNVILVDTRALATALGISQKTINNLGDEKFPIPCVRFGRNKYFRLVDAALYIDKSLGIEQEPTFAPALANALTTSSVAQPSSTKRGRGRPKNSTGTRKNGRVA